MEQRTKFEVGTGDKLSKTLAYATKSLIRRRGASGGHGTDGDPVSGSASSLTLKFRSRWLRLGIPNDEETGPEIVTMTDLGQRAGEVMAAIALGRTALVTKHGRFIAALVPLDSVETDRELLGFIASEAEWAEPDALEQDDSLSTTSDVAARLGLRDPSTVEAL